MGFTKVTELNCVLATDEHVHQQIILKLKCLPGILGHLKDHIIEIRNLLQTDLFLDNRPLTPCLACNGFI